MICIGTWRFFSPSQIRQKVNEIAQTNANQRNKSDNREQKADQSSFQFCWGNGPGWFEMTFDFPRPKEGQISLVDFEVGFGGVWGGFAIDHQIIAGCVVGRQLDDSLCEIVSEIIMGGGRGGEEEEQENWKWGSNGAGLLMITITTNRTIPCSHPHQHLLQQQQ